MALTVGELVRGMAGVALEGDASLAVTGVTADSREAGPGMLFVAVRGTGGDGHRFVEAALAAGSPAVAVMADAAGIAANAPARLVAADTRPLPSLLARRLHREPDRALVTAAVTGTNGKTTTAFLMRALLERVAGRCGLLGTIVYDDGERRDPAPLTTPGGPVFWDWLGRMRDHGCRGVSMELSSHALDQQRTAGLELDVAVMTNLTRDHLDYHHDLASYLAAKARILDLLDAKGGAAVLNAADPAFASLDVGGRRRVTFSPDPRVAADLVVTGARLGLDGSHLCCRWQGRDLEFTSPLVGRFNVENLAAALAAGLALGHDADTCAAALAAVPQVPGRVERFDLPQGALAVVDYAHTPDAVAAVLRTCDELSRGRLIAVFGCGGDRDRGKRPLMGRAAAEGADLVWITSDNPRSEEPAAICAEIEAGLDRAEPRRARDCTVVVDRRTAIAQALAAAGEGDVVVIAGKGHEDYQIVGAERRHFDDREVVRDWIAGEGRRG
ncbi:MAG TPA: UDP-N-acetylmuramoyl-L-alanyl-D-glutamate--2,6-diaminopimelate ligase [Candidatus Krumholzibacteria bacterium]|nr:UDP-N-acetylmuramoyl-L-alanyl-D-glutamate--2,6-diaminopimelate ligase [Candidatus Krumholzibacteria bacterium]